MGALNTNSKGSTMNHTLDGNDLRTMRVHCDKSTTEVAEHLNITRTTYENWENNVGQPKMVQFLKLLVFFSVEVSPLLNSIKQIVVKKDTKKNGINIKHE